MSLTQRSIFSQDFVNTTQEKFNEDAECSLEEAINRFKNISNASIPTWLWVVLAWFASDNIMGYISSPFMFYPMIMVGGCLLCVYQLGLLPILKELWVPVVIAKVNMTLDKIEQVPQDWRL